MSMRIAVIINLSQTFRRLVDYEEDDAKAFRKYISQYIDIVLKDLALTTTETSLIITLDESPNKFSLNPFEVIINDRKCRIHFTKTTFPDLQAKDVARLVSLVIYTNRELILTQTLSKKILESWSSGEIADLSLESFHEFLSEFVRLGFSVDRGKKSFTDVKDRSKWDPMDLFEQSILEWETMRIRVYFRKHEYPKLMLHKSFEALLEEQQENFFNELGILLPKVVIDSEDGLEENEFRIQINDLRLPPVLSIGEGELLVPSMSEALLPSNITGKKTTDPITGIEYTVIRHQDYTSEMQQKARSIAIDGIQYIVLGLNALAEKNAGAFLTKEIVEKKIDILEEIFPALVNTTLAHFEITKLTRLLRYLLDEGVSIKDLRKILECLPSTHTSIDIDQSKYVIFYPATPILCPFDKGKQNRNIEIIAYADSVRMYIKLYLAYKYSRGSSSLSVYLVDTKIEARIMEIDTKPLSDEEHDQLIRAIHDVLGRSVQGTRNQVIVTNSWIRRSLRSLIEKEFFRVPVLSYHELLPSLNIEVIGRISWKEG